MKLDKRITKIAIIYDCFDCKDARASIGEKGYFSHYYHCFSNLSECRFGVLQDIIDSEHPYDNGKNQYDFFLPERYVINSEKQYRPYTISEFYAKFHLGNGMILRPKNHKSLEFHVVYNGYAVDTGSNEIKLYLGCGLYTLPELFQSYERLENGRWVPFGVEE